MSSGVLPDYRLADFAPEMQQVLRWAVLIARANNLTRRSGWGLPAVWTEIQVGDFDQAAAALTREYAEYDDWPHARVVGIEAGCLLVRCPYCERVHRTEGLDYGHAESPCGRQGPYLIVDPLFVLPYDPAGGRRPVTDEPIPTDTRPRRFR